VVPRAAYGGGLYGQGPSSCDRRQPLRSLPWLMSCRCPSPRSWPAATAGCCGSSGRLRCQAWHCDPSRGSSCCAGQGPCGDCTGTTRAPLASILPGATATRSPCSRPALAARASCGWYFGAGAATTCSSTGRQPTQPNSRRCAAACGCAPRRQTCWDKMTRRAGRDELSRRSRVYPGRRASDRCEGVRFCI
jgi:hypothetical protein